MPVLPNAGQGVPGSVLDHGMPIAGAFTSIKRGESTGYHELWSFGDLVAPKVVDQLTQPVRVILDAAKGYVAPVAQPPARDHQVVTVVEYNTSVISTAGITDVRLYTLKRGFLPSTQESGAFSVLFQCVRGQRLFSNFLRGLVIGSLFGAEFLSPGCFVYLALFFYVLRVFLTPGEALCVESFEIGRTVSALISRFPCFLLRGFGGSFRLLSRYFLRIGRAPGAMILAPRNALFIGGHVMLHQLRSLVASWFEVRGGGYVSSIAITPFIAKGS